MDSFDHDALLKLGAAAREVDSPPRDGESRPATIARRTQATGGARALAALWLGLRALGALAVLAMGAVHLHLYLGLYSAIPTIGTLFVLNFVAATAIGLGLLAPLERILGRWGVAAVGLFAIAGAAMAATSFAFLAISEHTPLFGFMEPGYDPAAILASRMAEGTAVASLAAFLVARFALRARVARW